MKRRKSTYLDIMKRFWHVFVWIVVAVLVLSTSGCGKGVPQEPPQLTVACMNGTFHTERGGYTWDVMRHGSEVASSVTACGSDPLSFDFTPIPLRSKEDILFVFPQGMEPDGPMTGSFYPMINGEPDRDNPLGVVIRLENGERAQYSEAVYGYYPQIYGYPTEGIYVLRASWTRPRWRGTCEYAFAVKCIDPGVN